MDPWQDRRKNATPLPTDPSTCLPNCPDYPQCSKEERKYLNEIRAAGKNIPITFKLSNGMRATDFSLQYIMKNHFKRKPNSSKVQV